MTISDLQEVTIECNWFRRTFAKAYRAVRPFPRGPPFLCLCLRLRCDLCLGNYRRFRADIESATRERPRRHHTPTSRTISSCTVTAQQSRVAVLPPAIPDVPLAGTAFASGVNRRDRLACVRRLLERLYRQTTDRRFLDPSSGGRIRERCPGKCIVNPNSGMS
jgi:hypothetical protein